MDQPIAGQDPMPDDEVGSSMIGFAAANTEAENATVGLANNQPPRDTVKTSSRKRQAKAIVQAKRDFEDRQGNLDLATQQKLDFPDHVAPTEKDRAAIEAADAELAEFEATVIKEGQGGMAVSAA